MTVALGVDLATAEARVLAVDLDTGASLAERSYPLPVDDGEQPAHYGRTALRLIAAVAHDLGPRAAEVTAIAVTGTSGTVVPADERGVPRGSALLYNDSRGAELLPLLAAQGLGIRPSGALARAAWLHRNRPAPRYLFTADIVTSALAGELVASDTSHALKSGTDPVAATWDAAAAAILGLPLDTLPALTRPGRVIGIVAMASDIGLPTGVLIVSGMTDGATAQLATGAVALGDTVGVLGTTLVMKGVASSDVVDTTSGVYSHVAPDGAFWAGGASNTGAGVLRSGVTASLDVREADAAARALGPAPVISYPLSCPGERFPIADAAFPGFLVDLDGVPSNLGEPIARFRAALEGVAFVERRGLERLAALGVSGGRHHIAGGASASALWNGIRASVLDRQLLVPRHRSSAFGAALIAGAAVAGESIGDIVSRLAGAASVIDPVAELVHPLAERYAVFTETLDRATSESR